VDVTTCKKDVDGRVTALDSGFARRARPGMTFSRVIPGRRVSAGPGIQSSYDDEIDELNYRGWAP
jgi:hypothetical protein